MMKQEEFANELEKRLEENRKIGEKSYIPSFLQGVVAYLGFHSFRVLVLGSLGVTILLFLLLGESLMYISKWIFWL